MRQRITFLQDPAESIDPSKLLVTSTSISTPELVAAREERITFAFDELPQELYKVLKASHELHIRWVGESLFQTRAPLVARLSPGLHVFYTPLRNDGLSEFLCPLLKKVFGNLDCLSPVESFTTLPRDRFSHSSASQYFSPLPNLRDFKSYLAHKLCPSHSSNTDPTCLPRVQALSLASTLEIDFDTISHALTLTAFFPSITQSLSLSKPSSHLSSRMEIGILSVEKAKETEELSLGGFLAVLGENTKPSPTLFSFPARHHPLPISQTFTSNFIHPTGLHPTLELNITSSIPPLDDRACSLHAHLTLPRAVFVDKYQISDPLFLASKNLAKIHYITTPIDLEAPAYMLTSWGSTVLLELSPPLSKPKSKPKPESKSDSTSSNQHQVFTSQVPLHLRYLPPAHNSSGLTNLEIPYPILFWACTADEGSKFPVNPFDRVNLGYDGLFGPRTLFFHLSPSVAQGDRLVNSLEVPVLDLDRSRFVESLTALGVGLGFLWVMWCLLRVWRAAGYGSGSGALEGVKEEKKMK
ncbi:related to PBN1 protein, required for post-translational processing of the protease B precursor Prb1p [Rhynchosporium secalis]|uniref:Protein PBN1 n=1 Tax=Rhynchosporium secalis TaxID=38038 RepID=A0A1E1MKV5_RHYSE|nr:related to PBN1 protein, required for post-translational processing of the protease B precursor Prb1p [Rhynchosporium secalis]